MAPLLIKLATLLNMEGKCTEAAPLAHRAYLIAERAEDLQLSAVALNATGVILTAQGEYARAEPVLRRSLAMLKQAEGTETLDYAVGLNNLATAYAKQCDYAKAEKAMAQALKTYEKRLPPIARIWPWH